MMPYTILWRFYREKSINVRLKNKNSPNIPGRTSRSPLHTVRKHKAAIFACHTLPAEPWPGEDTCFDWLGNNNLEPRSPTVQARFQLQIDLFSFAVTWSTLGKQNIQDGGR